MTSLSTSRSTTRHTTTRRAALATTALALAMTLTACAADAPVVNQLTLGVAAADDLSVQLLSDAPLGTGLNTVYLKVTDVMGSPVTDATVTVTPLMTMPGPPPMTHRCPVMGAPELLSCGCYRAEVVFQMASGMMGSWSATVGVTRPGGPLKQATFTNLEVADTGRARTFQSGMSKFVVSMNLVGAPAVGLNPVVVTVHETTDMGMTYLPVEDATIRLDPQMPSMGHGSPGSIDPVRISAGRYVGKVSFSMAGTWVTTLTLARPGVDPLGSVAVTTTF
jgi:hypothetical protein